MIDIYEALKSGQTPDAIAQSFVDELNAAIAKQKADQAAAEEAAKAKIKREQDLETVVNCVNAYLAVYYPEVEPIDGQFIEDTINANKMANSIVNELKDGKPIEGIVDDVFGEFFKKYNI